MAHDPYGRDDFADPAGISEAEEGDLPSGVSLDTFWALLDPIADDASSD